ncbi:unnamed protein product [Pedinophyceae sp. YPF-701]|nr:unnamed protein product [Pedinophyceae sp. YPF-701]
MIPLRKAGSPRWFFPYEVWPVAFSVAVAVGLTTFHLTRKAIQDPDLSWKNERMRRGLKTEPADVQEGRTYFESPFRRWARSYSPSLFPQTNKIMGTGTP